VETALNFDEWMRLRQQQVELALEQWVAPHATCSLHHAAPVMLADAMRYAVLDGGKRLRPLLVFAAVESLCSAHLSQDHPVYRAAMRAACAVELIHAYSLVHDDMPCMDNDVLRRGKPTVHVKFGEASALLAGDALQALAFELLTPDEGAMAYPVQARLCALLSRAAGCSGMAGGQAIDLASVGHRLTERQLCDMHQRKTGALLHASVMMGVACAAPTTAATHDALHRYGLAMGLAFQVVDDILDVIADSATLGKTAGKDAVQDKPTYVSLMGLEASQAYARDLLNQALAALETSELAHTDLLRALAHKVVHRAC
jgi:farnesyl diphosphate synthase